MNIYNSLNLDIDECDTGNNDCDQLCENTEGKYTCDCNDGYSLAGNKRSCKDIDECVEDTHLCNTTDDTDATNVDCENTVGDYACTCSEKYAHVDGTDDRTCEPLNTAPTGINMTDGAVFENKADAVAASFAAVDEDAGDSHTFILLKGKDAFQLVDNTSLHTKDAIDFESVEGGYIPIQLMVAGTVE